MLKDCLTIRPRGFRQCRAPSWFSVTQNTVGWIDFMSPGKYRLIDLMKISIYFCTVNFQFSCPWVAKIRLNHGLCQVYRSCWTSRILWSWILIFQKYCDFVNVKTSVREVVFRFKQIPFSLLKSKVFDLSKILFNEWEKFASLFCR